MINVFVKNAPFVKVVKGRKMRDEYERPDTKAICKSSTVRPSRRSVLAC